MANPLAAGLGIRRKPDPCALVVFGASGDLTKRKLFPALYALAYRGLLPDRFAVVGVARTEQTTKQFLSGMRAAVKQHARDPYRPDVFGSLAAASLRQAMQDMPELSEISKHIMFEET